MANGYRDRIYIEANPDLEPLREREDFKKLVAELEVKNPPKAKP